MRKSMKIKYKCSKYSKIDYSYLHDRVRNEARRGEVEGDASANKPTSLIAKIQSDPKVKGQTNLKTFSL